MRLALFQPTSAGAYKKSGLGKAQCAPDVAQARAAEHRASEAFDVRKRVLQQLLADAVVSLRKTLSLVLRGGMALTVSRLPPNAGQESRARATFALGFQAVQYSERGARTGGSSSAVHGSWAAGAAPFVRSPARWDPPLHAA